MNAPALDVQGPMLALLELVEAGRAQQCAQILGEARAQAAARRAQSVAEAHARVSQAFAEQHRHHDERLAAAQARLATQRRLHAQQHTAGLLALAREQLPRELLACWADPATRSAWVSGTLAAARRRLPTGGWTVSHAAGWPEAALREAITALHPLVLVIGDVDEAVPVPDIAARLRTQLGLST